MELIEKAWLKTAIKNFFKGLNHTPTEEDIQAYIDYAPIIEMKKSAITQKERSVWKSKSFHVVYCNNCKFEFDIMRCEFIGQMNYCPYCGANMQQNIKEQNAEEKS